MCCPPQPISKNYEQKELTKEHFKSFNLVKIYGSCIEGYFIIFWVFQLQSDHKYIVIQESRSKNYR